MGKEDKEELDKSARTTPYPTRPNAALERMALESQMATEEDHPVMEGQVESQPEQGIGPPGLLRRRSQSILNRLTRTPQKGRNTPGEKQRMETGDDDHQHPVSPSPNPQHHDNQAVPMEAIDTVHSETDSVLALTQGPPTDKMLALEVILADIIKNNGEGRLRATPWAFSNASPTTPRRKTAPACILRPASPQPNHLERIATLLDKLATRMDCIEEKVNAPPGRQHAEPPSPPRQIVQYANYEDRDHPQTTAKTTTATSKPIVPKPKAPL
ncbi:hypothetical protein B0H21DRAFT_828931 [Amylocystis lapponica]|nr:hypothetical protein B0H21DRAFT_828931 [Amylocystis lapponica]